MRMIFGVASLLVALAVVGVLAKKQLAATRTPVTVQQPAHAAPATVRQRSLDMQQQVKQAVESSLQQPRPMPEDDK
ncbi:MAG: hypothetical protein Q7T87_09475 [Polaromonas sp.]|nr:hypothetical protein [Polaromonas sp.]